MLVCAVVMTATPLHAQEPQPQPQQQPTQQPREHVVRKGDTLWDLARSYLNDPFRWPMIYEANRRVVENPHWIYPAERIIIPGLMTSVDTVQAPPVVVADAGPPPRSRFYAEPAAPREPTVLSSETQRNAIIRPEEWISAPWLARESELGLVGRVIAPVDPRNMDNKLPHTFHPRSRAYLSMPANIGDRFLVVRLKHQVPGHGWVVQPMAVVRVDTVGGNTSRAMVIDQFADMKVGDLVMPVPRVPAIPTTEPRVVAGGSIGRILDVMDQQPLYGTTDIAFVDLGTARGMHIGDEVVAFLPERSFNDELRSHKLPAEPVAQMRIIKLTDNTATVRITRVRHAVFSTDLPVRVARQQP